VASQPDADAPIDASDPRRAYNDLTRMIMGGARESMRARTRLSAVATAVVAAIDLTLPVTALLTDTFGGSDGSGDGWPRSPRASNDPPRRGNQLAVCVEGIHVDPAVVQIAKTAIESTIEEIALADPLWTERHSLPERVVHVGCPYPPAISDRYGCGRVVRSPSYYQTFVFVLSVDQFRDSLALDDSLPLKYTVLTTAEECTCSGDNCGQVTYGLYLTPEDLGDRNRFLYDMYRALYAAHLAKMPGPPELYQEPVEAQLPPLN